MQLFGTDGIRGEARTFPLDASTLPLIGQAIGERLGGRILIGRDPRESGPEMLDLLTVGIEAGGAKTEDAGVVPTPAIALLASNSDLAGGIMISASHNPYKDNGIKVFGSDGRKLDDAAEDAIEARVATLQLDRTIRTEPRSKQRVGTGDPRWLRRYGQLLAGRFEQCKWLEGLHLTLDCANGSMSPTAPEFLKGLGATITAIHSEPNGTNINVDCGAVHPESLVETVRDNGSDLGVAYDGDGDRSIFASSSGRLIDGDAVLLVMSRLLRRKEQLIPPVVVGTAMTNFNLERSLASDGVSLVRVGVGDRHIFREMLARGAHLGGEPSGHTIFSDFGLSGDGLLTTLKLCEAMVMNEASLDELTTDWSPAPQLLRNIAVAERVPLETIPAIGRKIDRISRTLAGRGRIVVRYSGTEPLLRVMVESDSASLNEACATDLIEVVRNTIGTRE